METLELKFETAEIKEAVAEHLLGFEVEGTNSVERVGDSIFFTEQPEAEVEVEAEAEVEAETETETEAEVEAEVETEDVDEDEEEEEEEEEEDEEEEDEEDVPLATVTLGDPVATLTIEEVPERVEDSPPVDDDDEELERLRKIEAELEDVIDDLEAK